MSKSERIFTAATDELLVEMISKACQRIVFVAPGVTEQVAEALGARLSQEDKLRIEVILDADPEVYRLGFGTVNGITKLKSQAQAHMFGLRHQSGIRIGILIVDDKTLIYAPTPQLIEAGPSVEKPNAVLLEGQEVSSIAKAAAATPDSLPLSGEIGNGPLTPQQLQTVTDDLERYPPKPFDLTRQAHVFSSRLQYVEFEVKNYQVLKKEVQIPPDLMGFGGTDGVADRLRSSLRVIDEGTATVTITRKSSDGNEEKVTVSQDTLKRERLQIERDFMVDVPGYGRLIFKDRQSDFQERIAAFTQLLRQYTDALKSELKKQTDAIVERVARSLLPNVLQTPPRRYTLAVAKPSPDDILEMLTTDLKRACDVETILEAPRVRCVFKDISYQSIASSDFMKRLHTTLRRRNIPERIVKDIFRESYAVLEKGGKLV